MKKLSSETQENNDLQADVAASPAPTAPTLDEVLNAINVDCRVAPDSYIDEVDIPGGGE